MSYQLVQLAGVVRKHLDAEPRVSLAELSKRLGICRQTIEKAIRTATGRSFHQSRSELLAVKARRLLAIEGTKSIKEIAYSLGYSSPQAFARFVRMACGCSPSQLRELWPSGGAV